MSNQEVIKMSNVKLSWIQTTVKHQFEAKIKGTSLKSTVKKKYHLTYEELI